MKRIQLGDLQHSIMKVLWDRGRATAAEVHQELLEDRGLAPTTIATMLSKMEKKGVVTHDTEGRRFVYRPTVSEAAVRRSTLSELTDRWFEGSAGALVSHLLSEHEIEDRELDQLRALVDEASRTRARKGDPPRTRKRRSST
jgi:predicted transcriptional regulator